MKSNFLNKELVLGVTATNGTNVVNNKDLTKVLYHDSDLKEYGIKETYIQYKTDVENGCFAFECVLTTKDGAEFRGCGESNADNLKTEKDTDSSKSISSMYPLTMARKRALSAALINMLDLDEGEYSDVHIQVDVPSGKTDVPAETPVKKTPAKKTKKATAPVKPPVEAPVDVPVDAGDIPTDIPTSVPDEPVDVSMDVPDMPVESSANSEEVPDVPSDISSDIPADIPEAIDDPSSPVIAGDLPTDMLDGMDLPTEDVPTEDIPMQIDLNNEPADIPDAPVDVPDAPVDTPVEPTTPDMPVEEDDVADMPTVGSASGSDGEDIYDTTKVNIGTLGSLNLSIREAYNSDDADVKKAFLWICNTMRVPTNPEKKKIKELCIEFLNSMKG